MEATIWVNRISLHHLFTLSNRLSIHLYLALLHKPRFFLLNSWRTLSAIWNNKKLSMTLNVKILAFPLKQWSSSCTLTWTKSMGLNPLLLNGLLLSFILSRFIWEMIIKLPSLQRFSKMSVMKNSGSFKLMWRIHSAIYLKFCLEKSITLRVKQK